MSKVIHVSDSLMERLYKLRRPNESSQGVIERLLEDAGDVELISKHMTSKIATVIEEDYR